jgi:hypothetical protein
MACHVIRKMRLAHCKRGPATCEQCREMDEPRICLLDVCPSDGGMMQRRVIKLSIDGEEVWREFDVVRVFESEEAARAYALEKGVEDVEL